MARSDARVKAQLRYHSSEKGKAARAKHQTRRKASRDENFRALQRELATYFGVFTLLSLG